MSELVTKVLSYWQPQANLADYSNKNRELIRDQFHLYLSIAHEIEITNQSIHSPIQLKDWAYSQSDWHQDDNGINRKFIVWSNIQPTDFIFLDGHMLEAKNGAVIIINNLEGNHRTPMPLNPKRWLIRTDYLI